MKQIIKVSCDDKEYHIQTEGKYIDLVSGVVHLIKAISKSAGVSTEVVLGYINGYLEDDDINMERVN
ncbi:hypothetical protein ACR77J_15885 [Tissierella praeacuta]|uniref:hypothetical protein n=1 Tax=Tissierella praeacuta TaxID=43131 RepID=UPI003DA44F4C